MIPTDYFVVDTPYGEKTIEFRNMDITKIEEEYDVLVVSAFIGNYTPDPGTLISALHHNLGIFVEDLEQDPFIDLRDQMHVWITKEINGQKFSRILVAELADLFDEETVEIADVFNNIYALLALVRLKGVRIKRVVMPVLGTGNIGLPPKEVLAALLEESRIALLNLSELETIIFCERSEEKALELINNLDALLKRAPMRISDDQQQHLLNPVLKDINNGINRLPHTASENIMSIVKEWNLIYREGEFNARAYGHFCRQFLENFLTFYAKPQLGEDTFKRIKNLVWNQKFAPWVGSYLHTLRVTGNFYSHTDHIGKKPSELEFKDLLITLNSLHRLVDFWNGLLKTKGNGA